jgi:hypothetical protein
MDDSKDPAARLSLEELAPQAVVISGDTSPLKTRREVTIMGAQLFALGAFITILIFLSTRVVTDFHSLEFGPVFLFAYIVIPLSASVGAIISFRTCRTAIEGNVAAISVGLWVVSFLVLGWFTILYYFAHTLRTNVLLKDQQKLGSAVFYFVLMLMISVAVGYSRDRSAYLVLLYGILASWFCCDTLLVNLLRTMRSKGELAPLPTIKFQFSLATLMMVMLVGGGWITGLVAMLKS